MVQLFVAQLWDIGVTLSKSTEIRYGEPYLSTLARFNNIGRPHEHSRIL